ncbi:MAG: nucleotidyltransferase family protein [Thioalkalivibrionaceae bacterium]
MNRIEPSHTRVMLLAAGRGARMRELTDHCPKPMLEVGGKPLLAHALDRIVAAGYRDITLNVAWQGQVIVEWITAGAGGRLNPLRAQGHDITVRISQEPPGALETAGGILHALYDDGRALVDAQALAAPILVVNADVLCDHPLTPPALADGDLGHLVLAPNPGHHPSGDFRLVAGRVLPLDDDPATEAAEGPTSNPYLFASPHHAVAAIHAQVFLPSATFCGIAWYRGALFAGLPPGPAALGPILKSAATAGRLSGEIHDGLWLDVGTPERLIKANAMVGHDTAEDHGPGTR